MTAFFLSNVADVLQKRYFHKFLKIYKKTTPIPKCFFKWSYRLDVCGFITKKTLQQLRLLVLQKASRRLHLFFFEQRHSSKPRFATLLKMNAVACVFLWILQFFSKQLVYKTPVDDFFWVKDMLNISTFFHKTYSEIIELVENYRYSRQL